MNIFIKSVYNIITELDSDKRKAVNKMSHKKKSTQTTTDTTKSNKFTDKSDSKSWSDKSGNNSYTDKSDSDSQNYSD